MKDIINDIKTAWQSDPKECMEIVIGGVTVFAIGAIAMLVAFAFGG